MTTPDPNQPRSLPRLIRDFINTPFGYLKPFLPRGLFPRSLLIIVTPMVILQLVVTLIFFERHYQLVTRRLSAAIAGDIAMLISLYEDNPVPATLERLEAPARRTMHFELEYLPDTALPAPARGGLVNPLYGVVENQLSLQIRRPFWFDTDSIPSHVDIRILLDNGTMRVLVRRSRVLATNWHIFLGWMLLSSVLLLIIAYFFLRNQIRPIQRLATAAEAFGRGRDVPDFRPSGAAEVRAAARALIDMRVRMARHIDQRTDLLAGISHDMRTPITRMKLQLAFLEDSPDVEAMKSDIAEMEYMLDEYLAFARGEGAEQTEPVDIADLLHEVADDSARKGRAIEVDIDPAAAERLSALPARRGGLKRCITNLVDNALTHGKTVRLSLWSTQHFFEIVIEDDGPGIPPAQYEEAFKPFRRLDEGLRTGVAGSGLGLSISRDLARAHGGDVRLSPSPMGGLKAVIRLPI